MGRMKNEPNDDTDNQQYYSCGSNMMVCVGQQIYKHTMYRENALYKYCIYAFFFIFFKYVYLYLYEGGGREGESKG